MKVLGLVFAGTRTPHAELTAGFFEQVLGLQPSAAEHATSFDLPDGSRLAVQQVPEDEQERTVGLLVDDVHAAAAELRARGIATDDVTTYRDLSYVHFRAPDGALYELVQRLPVHPGQEAGQHDGAP